MRKNCKARKNRHSKTISILVLLPLAANTLVLERDQSPGKSFIFYQLKIALRKAAGKKRKSFTEQHRNHAEMKFIDQVGFQEVARNFTAAHQPYVFAFALTDFFHQHLRRDVHKGLAFALARRQRAGKNISLDL